MNKKADAKMIGGQTIKLILGVAVVVVLVILIYNLISPYFDANDQAAESYLKLLKQGIRDADKGLVGEFLIWQGDFYLVYFGSSPWFEGAKSKFFSGAHGDNYACICYFEGEQDVCNHCVALDHPAELSSIRALGKDQWFVGKDEKTFITRPGEGYVFSRDLVKKTARILGKNRTFYYSGRDNKCYIFDLKEDDVGGNQEFVGEYKLERISSRVVFTGETPDSMIYFRETGLDFWDDSLDYLTPAKNEYEEGTENIRLLRKDLETKKDNIKFHLEYDSNIWNMINEGKDLDLEMELTKDGLKVEIEGVVFVYSNSWGDGGKLEWVKEGDLRNADTSNVNNEILKDFENSLKLEENKISVGEEKFSIGLTTLKPSLYSREQQILYLDAPDEFYSLDKESFGKGKLYAINSEGEMYWIFRRDFGSGRSNEWVEIEKGEKEGAYIYLDDEELEKTKVIKQLKDDLTKACFGDIK